MTATTQTTQYKAPLSIIDKFLIRHGRETIAQAGKRVRARLDVMAKETERTLEHFQHQADPDVIDVEWEVKS